MCPGENSRESRRLHISRLCLCLLFFVQNKDLSLQNELLLMVSSVQ